MNLRSVTVSFLLFVSCKPGGDTASADGDGDGVNAPADCDDAVASTYPGAPEICDGIDNNCDAAVDNDATVGGRTWYVDADGDTFGGTGTVLACEQPDGYAATSDDCDDVDPDVYPGAPETDCKDPVDFNCDGSAGGSSPRRSDRPRRPCTRADRGRRRRAFGG